MEKRFENRLTEQGYITHTQDHNINLNKKIQPFTKLGSDIEIEVATFNDVKITGISGNDNYKHVEFQIFYTLNELGKDISYPSNYLIETSRMDFQKYDDGWRTN
jgi:hypothetical protein